MTEHHRARAADRVRRILAETIRKELRDPRVGFVTLTEVRLSPDLQYAVAYVTFRETERREDSLRALNRAARFLRRRLARSAGLRTTPRLRFVEDDVFERATRLEQIFDELDAERRDAPDET